MQVEGERDGDIAGLLMRWCQATYVGGRDVGCGGQLVPEFAFHESRRIDKPGPYDIDQIVAFDVS